MAMKVVYLRSPEVLDDPEHIAIMRRRAPHPPFHLLSLSFLSPRSVSPLAPAQSMHGATRLPVSKSGLNSAVQHCLNPNSRGWTHCSVVWAATGELSLRKASDRRPCGVHTQGGGVPADAGPPQHRGVLRRGGGRQADGHPDGSGCAGGTCWTRWRTWPASTTPSSRPPSSSGRCGGPLWVLGWLRARSKATDAGCWHPNFFPPVDSAIAFTFCILS